MKSFAKKQNVSSGVKIPYSSSVNMAHGHMFLFPDISFLLLCERLRNSERKEGLFSELKRTDMLQLEQI